MDEGESDSAGVFAWGSFTVLLDKNQQNLRTILETEEKTKPRSGSNEQKIGDYYASCMDTSGDRHGGRKADRAGYGANRGGEGCCGHCKRKLRDCRRAGANAMFRFGSRQDAKDSSQVIARQSRAGSDCRIATIICARTRSRRRCAKTYVTARDETVRAAGRPGATRQRRKQGDHGDRNRAGQGFDANVDVRDPNKTYHRMTRRKCRAGTEFFLDDLFQRGGLAGAEGFERRAAGIFQGADAQLYIDAASRTGKRICGGRLVHSAAPGLSDPFVKRISISRQRAERAEGNLAEMEAVCESTDRSLGEALGRVYVEKNFPPEAKAQALDHGEQHHGGAARRFPTLDWMSPATRTQAITKLQAIGVKIGYPDKWRDYSS